MGLPLINVFDPWRSKLCTCPFKYSVAPYTGCGHGCIYCYITGYIRDAFSPRPKKDFNRRFTREALKLKPGSILEASASSDPYQPLEDRYRYTRLILEWSWKLGVRVLIVTKSDLVVRDANLIRKTASVSLTITTLDEKLSRRLEPHASSPSSRVKALRLLSRSGVKCSVRVDPIIPLINSSEESIRMVVRAAAEAGALHIISSTFKARWDSIYRIARAFPEVSGKIKDLYRSGERISGYFYLPERERLRLMRIVREAASEYGLTFSTCREGFPQLNTGPSCDGSHLIPEANPRPMGRVDGYALHTDDYG